MTSFLSVRIEQPASILCNDLNKRFPAVSVLLRDVDPHTANLNSFSYLKLRCECF